MALPSWQIEAEKRGWGAVIYDVTDRDAWNRTFGGPLPVSVVYALDTTLVRPRRHPSCAEGIR